MARTLSMLFSDLTSHVAPIVSVHNDEDKVKWGAGCASGGVGNYEALKKIRDR